MFEDGFISYYIPGIGINSSTSILLPSIIKCGWSESNVAMCSIITCLVGPSPTNPLWRPIPRPFIQDDSTEPPWEEELLSLEKVCTYLAQGRWFRRIRTTGCFELGGYHYYLGNDFARRSVAIGFDPDSTAWICQPEGSEETIRLPAQGGTSAELMGELAALQALPIYQLALPFSLAAWRQLEYAHNLTGTTL